MKYSKGDKVRIRNIGWYEEMLSIPSKLVWQNKLTEDFIGIWCGSHVFRKEMCEFCGKVMTIQEVGIDFYLMEEDKMGYEFTDEMIAGEDVSWMYDGNLVAERFSDDKGVPKFRKDDRVETHDGLFGYIEDIEYDGVRKCYQYYVSFIVDGGYYYEEQLKFHVKKESASIVPKFKVGDMICRRLCGLSNGYLVTSVSDEYYGLSLSLPDSNGVGVLSVADQDEWVLLSDSNAEDIVNSHYEDEIGEMVESHSKDLLNDLYNLGMENSRKEAIKLGIASEHIVCPDGYEFRDGDGNLIAVDKIVLAKKSVSYPKSYEECCDIVGVLADYVWDGYKQDLFRTFHMLYICRDAYWKIAGEEMGLGKSWEPDWGNSEEKRYCIVNIEGDRNLPEKILTKWILKVTNKILVFPTEEMRDTFYEAFKELIEECKELL